MSESTNPESLLSTIGKELIEAAHGTTDKIYLIWDGENFRATTDILVKGTAHVIACYQAIELRAGLTQCQWSALQKLIIACKEGKICKKNPSKS